MVRSTVMITLVLCFALGCAKKDDMSGASGGVPTGNQTPQNKNLFSRWTDPSGFYYIDLSSASFGSASSMQVVGVTGQSCSCQILVNGTQASGTTNITSCTGSHPDCASFNGTGQYTKSATTLEICEAPNSCTSLK